MGRGRGGGGHAICQRVAAIDGQVGHAGRLPGGDLQFPQLTPATPVARLQPRKGRLKIFKIPRCLKLHASVPGSNVSDPDDFCTDPTLLEVQIRLRILNKKIDLF